MIPSAGGGSIPLEAQRLGLKAYGSDLNPVAVLITKALIEIPPKFAGQPPVNLSAKKKMTGKGMWTGARGLADDVRYYGQWMRDRASERIGQFYPKATLPNGEEATVIAWLWARTVLCSNPACGARMPLVRSFALSTKPGKRVWVKPLIDHREKQVKFEVRDGEEASETGTKQRNSSRCLFCGNVMNDAQVRAVATAHGFGEIPIAVVAEGSRGRTYLAPESHSHPEVPRTDASWLEQPMPSNPRWFSPPGYGLPNFRDLFTARQLLALTTFSDLVTEARERAVSDGASTDYANAVATYLAFAVDKGADYWSSICSWHSSGEKMRNTFGRQAIPMVWDYAECNPLSDSTGNWMACIDWVWKAIEGTPARGFGDVRQLDATTVTTKAVFSTDPPYYDNIGYADLSDFFYVWLRRSIGWIYPDVCSTLLVPKKQELIATPYRFEGSRQRAQEFFEEGFAKAFVQIRGAQDPGFPMTVYYAFKQAETDEDREGENTSAHASTGWETMLEGLLRANFQVTGTWPMRSELTNRMIASGTNALASSIVLACRPRLESATITTRKDFLGSLKKELPHALRNLQKGNIAPVDLAQAAIGPGMAVFSRYKKVLETDGSPMRVRTALGLINQGLDEVLSELESEFDPDTRWALAWFEQHQFDEGPYGEAEVLATAKALSISHLAGAGILRSGAGKVRLLRREDLPEAWDPSTVGRLTVWEVTQHLIRSLDQKGETETANLKAKIGGMAEIARDLAYRLYTLCERKGWAEEAGYYNSLVVAWPSMASEAFELT